MVHNNSVSSRALTNWHRYFMMKEKSADFLWHRKQHLKIGIIMYHCLRYQHRYDYPASSASTTNFPRLCKLTRWSQLMSIS
jgi:GT2 family glycosyltransferase